MDKPSDNDDDGVVWTPARQGAAASEPSAARGVPEMNETRHTLDMCVCVSPISTHRGTPLMSWYVPIRLLRSIGGSNASSSALKGRGL